jgi:hypothetical protein
MPPTSLANLDRRWTFLLIGIVVAVPILTGLRFPEEPSPMVRDVFKSIDELPDGSRVLMAFDYDPASQGELHPMAAAFTRHCALKRHKLLFLTLWPPGTAMVQNQMDMLRREFPEYEYGRDYVNIGYRPGYEGPIKLMVTDLRRAVSVDVNGTPLDQLPLTRGVKNIQQMDLIINVSAGYPGAKEWVQYASTPYGITMVAGTTGVQVPLLMPYVPQQMRGMLGAIKGAAEYEQLLIENYAVLKENVRAQEALRRMGPQLVAHIVLILLIITGNVIYFLERRRTA